jgi:hypothetical protein
MARGRMINKKISNSKRVNDLPLPAQLLFTWLIAHLDCNGCFYGSAQMIKSLVVPRKNWTKKQIEAWLKIMEASKNSEGIPLICRYMSDTSVDGEQYLFMPGFEGEQIGLRKDKEKGEFPTFDGKMTESVGQKFPLRGREGEGEVEQEVEVETKEEDKEETKQEESLVQSSKSIKEILFTYQENILLGATVPEDIENEIKSACGRYSPWWVYDAIREACRANHPDWGYIMGILRKWSKEGKKIAH